MPFDRSSEYDDAVQRNVGLGQLFREQAEQQPTAVAVVDEDTTLTYHDLDLKASAVARQLFPLNKKEPVGILCRHGVWGIVAQIAVIYAGGNCATMDPALPEGQILARLKKLQARHLLVDRVNSHRNMSFNLIHVEPDSFDTPQCPKCDLFEPVHTDLEHRTHLIHTSGTTSEPKAVEIATRSVLEVVYHAPFEPVLATDVVAHVNNTSFDVSLFDIWGPLLRGARIAVLKKAVLLDLPKMAEQIDRLGITFMATTTALLNLAASTYPRAFEKLRFCWIGGEAANVSAIETILREGPPQNLINAYGPTECCVLCMAHLITIEDVKNGAVSIGKPIGRTIASIRDEDGQPVADGMEGELWIAGPGVSPGYVNQPEKNKTAFVEIGDDIGGQKQIDSRAGRFYRTGDIVRRRPDGQIDYVGRRDHQVKVRGYRIELDAVESAMLKTGLFLEAVAMKVTPAQDGAGSLLVAYAVPVATSQPDQVILEVAADNLRRLIPDYMIPTIELIQSMPLNSHAKVDRKLLTALYLQRWEAQSTVYSKDKLARTDDTCWRLACLWASLLGMPTLPENQDDDFFALGGTSLQAALLIHQIRKCFDIELSLLSLYKNSTLSALTHVLEERHHGAIEAVQDERDVWVANTLLADNLPCPTEPIPDWRNEFEGRVFFTGATGFVGAFMIADILRLPEVRQVCCLVRAASPAVGLQRLRRALEKYGVWQETYTEKLLIVCGSLEEPDLGLGPEKFRQLGYWASVIFHLGARVNYTQPYSCHHPANTIGTINIIRLSLAGRPKSVQYISSISCFGPTGYFTGTRVVNEDESLLPHLDALPYDHGYAQSQWVVEQLLRRLINRGFPIAVYRPGFITGHSKTGACNPDDFFSRLIQACLQMGTYPCLPNQRKEFVPVDYVSSVVLHIASSPTALGHAYHIVPPNPDLSVDMDDTMDLVGQSSGGGFLQNVPYAQWIEQLARDPMVSLQPLQPMLAEKVHNGLTRWELYENMPVYATENTERELATYPGKLVFPRLDNNLMQKYLAWLQKG